jgi:cyclic beta-1,2-glucan synthetase
MRVPAGSVVVADPRDPASLGREVALGQAGRPLVRAAEPIRRTVARLGRRLGALAGPLAQLPPDAPGARDQQWLLDNGHVLEVALAQVGNDLPPAFHRLLPASAGSRSPRVAQLAARALEGAEPADAAARLSALLDGYQEIAPLSMAELWAFPSFVRLAALERAAVVGEALIGAGVGATPGLDAAGCVRWLRELGAVDWRELFEGVSRVEARLRDDPAEVYPRMDFASRDRCRKVVERLARSDPKKEGEVAATVLAKARDATPGTAASHVGYWLLDAGLEPLERELETGPRTLRERGVRAILRHPRGVFFGGGSLALVGLVAILGAAAVGVGLGGWRLAVLLVLSLVPALTVAEALLHGVLGALVPPRLLPKLDFSAQGIPPEHRTLVAFPVLLGSAAEVDGLLKGLEINALANPDPELGFALLSDWTDAPTPEQPTDAALLARAVAGIERLNARSNGRFHLLHRARRFNPSQGCWMGWERKRGKLDELNRLLAGEGDGFSTRVGAEEFLRDVRHVITLDADTLLPRATARQLVGALAHPLNAPELAPDGRVLRGFGILQPRTEVSPESASRSYFARLLAGLLGPDLYNSAVSNVYQDLFAEGIFAGKGIYDVRAFAASLRGRVPENRVLSHDLFEGLHTRVAYLSDVAIYEDVPSHVLGELARVHRWARGDWQLLAWLGRRVPAADGGTVPSRFSALDRFKLADNLRRSLVEPTALALFLAGLLVLPGEPWIWSVVALGPLFARLLLTGLRLFVRLLSVRRGWIFVAAEGGHGFARGAVRVLVELMLLPVRAQVMLDAIVRTLYRLAISRRRLLEWRTAARTARQLGPRPPLGRYFGRLWAAPVAAAMLAAASLGAGSRVEWIALPIVLLWLAAPWVSFWSGRPADTPRRDRQPITEEDRRRLRLVARRTWSFFERFVRPEDHWLPPDNLQEVPHDRLARRTSPTNIGCYLLASLAAYDLGYLDARQLAARLRTTLDTLERLPRHRGHFWNWLSTETLAPLEPRYVSTVDSGNLAAALIALARGVEEIAAGPAVRPGRAAGLADAVAVLRETVALAASRPRTKAETELELRLATLESDLRGAPRDGRSWRDRLQNLHEHVLPALTDPIHRWLEHRIEAGVDRSAAGEIVPWLDRLRRDVADELAGLEGWAEEASAGLSWLAATATSAAARELVTELRELAATGERLALEMDFGFLFDPRRKLFRIGFDAERGELDPNHYDLLASEVRLTSLWAIAKGDVPIEHWLHLGRPYGRMAGERALLSWGGTAFEYLMPDLLLRSPRRTPLARSVAAATRRQIEYAARRGVPWGISESAYHHFGAQDWYQYRAFGVPGTGLRRGLGERLVVAPYASLLAVSVEPRAVLRNLDHLTREGAAARFGFYEAIDYGATGEAAVVRSFMSHHQGMILAALDNSLAGGPLVRRFHADPRVASAEILLYEEARLAPLADVRLGAERTTFPEETRLPTWRAEPAEGRTAVHVLANGRLSTTVTAAGGGGSRWQGVALVPWSFDPARERQGHWIYLRDLDSGALWSAGRAPTAAVPDAYEVDFAPHQVEIRRRDHQIRLHVTIAVAPGVDVEVRLLRLANESERPRRLAITSFAEVALAGVDEAARHPAFARLFVESEFLPAANALHFQRRPRSIDAAPVHLVVALVPGPAVRWESSREAFLGRGERLAQPAGLRPPPRPGTAGATLDPAAVLETHLALEPGGRAQIAFVTAVGESREAALALLERLRDIAQIEALLNEARRQAKQERRELELLGDEYRQAQRLLTAVLAPPRSLRPAVPWSPAGDWLGQRGLWGHGISGDLPIVLVRLEEEPNRALVRSLLVIHALWRRRAIEIDLVLLDEHGEGYAWPLRDWLDRELDRTGALDWLHRRGGIFVLRASGLPTADRELLRVAARVLVDGSAPSLDAVLDPCDLPPERLPPFVPVPSSPPSREPTPPLRRPADLRLDNGFGGFTADGREYVVQPPAGTPTPAPWINVVANEEAGFLVSETGAGCTWIGNSGENRLTPWLNDPLADPTGEAMYLRDEETGEVWSPTPLPAGGGADYQVRHGAGQTRFFHHRAGLLQELTLFVPRRDPVKIVRLRLENVWRRPRRITATYFAEWVLGPRRPAIAPLLSTDFRRTSGILTARNPFHPDRSRQVAFLAADRQPHGFTADRTEFLGGGGHDLARPSALYRIGLAEAVGNGLDPCAALQVHVDLPPGGVAEIAFLLGAEANFDAVQALVERYREPGRIEAARVEVLGFWDQVLGAVEVETPLPELDLLANRWLLHQNLSCRIWGRSGLYQSSGAYGFRDQLQDVCALSFALPAVARAHLLRAAARQFAAGDVLHWWHPEGWRGIRTRCSDDLLWLPFATLEYVATTDDRSVLDEEVPFLAGAELPPGKLESYDEYVPGRERGTLYEHCRRALVRGSTRGPQGLPKIGSCDWNDGLDHVGPEGRGESVWLAWFLIVVLERFAPLAESRGDRAEAEACLAGARHYRAAIERSAWDGDWYRRATFDDGTPLGSHESTEARIDLLPQAWAAWAGAPPDRVERALAAAFDQLLVPELDLLRLLAPPFDQGRPWPGYIAGYPPGVRENGGQYNHAAVWGAWAALLAGDADRALAVIRGILPSARAATREGALLYRLEPYALAGDIYSEPPHAGRGGWSWYSGSAGWLHRLIVEGLLGLVVRGEILVLAPNLPAAWPGARARLRRGATSYRIAIDARAGGREVARVVLDGQVQTGATVPLVDDGGEHEIEVVLGAASSP